MKNLFWKIQQLFWNQCIPSWASQSPKPLALQEELKSAISAIVGPEVGVGLDVLGHVFEYAKWLAEIFESLK